MELLGGKKETRWRFWERGELRMAVIHEEERENGGIICCVNERGGSIRARKE